MKVRLYGKSNCSYCKLAERFLQNRNIPYDYVSANDPGVTEYLIEKVNANIRSVPVVVIDDVYVGGYEELQTYINENTTFENGETKIILKG
jgi:glutaredoxin